MGYLQQTVVPHPVVGQIEDLKLLAGLESSGKQNCASSVEAVLYREVFNLAALRTLQPCAQCGHIVFFEGPEAIVGPIDGELSGTQVAREAHSQPLFWSRAPDIDA
eukprot:1872736-Rhodomonas_salina.1